MPSTEIIFEVTEDDWADLKAMAREAVCYFDADALPKVIRLHLVKHEAISV
ncbi:hypothetical protein [Candidatus Palauibacter sp.]|uniref:hypothetical protein n=1 Tax=Candidatus Palauibacter sp. TaxID=3101350 RepID=UPI003B024827